MANIKIRNGQLSAPTEAKFNVGRYAGGYLYISYTQGNETSVSLNFKVIDRKHPVLDKPFYIMSNGEKYTVALVETDQVVPIPVPESADILIVEINSDVALNANNPAIIDIFFNGDSMVA